jgi:hypothetical protein
LRFCEHRTTKSKAVIWVPVRYIMDSIECLSLYPHIIGDHEQEARDLAGESKRTSDSPRSTSALFGYALSGPSLSGTGECVY